MSRFPKITETFVLHEILEIQKHGLDVEVYPLLLEKTTVEHPEVRQLDGKVHYIPFLNVPVVLANLYFLLRHPFAYWGAMARALATTVGDRKLFIGALGILPKVVSFAYDMRRRGVHHVHAHFATHPTLAARAIQDLTGIPFSFTAHGSDIHVSQRGLAAKLHDASFAVMVSNYNREFVLRKCGEFAATRLHVIHCGIAPDLSDESPREPESQDGPFRILCVAALREVKGHRYLIEACKQLSTRNLNFQCDIVGEGPLRDAIRQQIRESDLGDVVTLHGALPRPQVLEKMRRSDVVVLPSVRDRRGRREGIPVTLMEAMACGVPVISSALSGIPELVDPGETGILTPPGDSGALADALEELGQSEEKRRELGIAGRRRVFEQFDLKNSVARLAMLFRTT